MNEEAVVAEAEAPETTSTPEPKPAKEAPSIRESVEKAFKKTQIPEGKDEADPDADEHGTGKPLRPTKDGGPEKVQEKASTKQADKAKEDQAKRDAEEKRDARAGENAQKDDERERQSRQSEDDQDDLFDDDEGEDGDDDEAHFSEPPQRFSSDAKKAWAEAPLPVRAEINRAMEEMQQGIEKYKGDAEAYEEFRDFHERLKQGNQRFEDVLGHYVGMENLLMQDPIEGFRRISQNLGMPLEQIASQVLNKPLDQRTQYYVQTIQSMQNTVNALNQQLQTLQQRQMEQVYGEAEAELNSFIEENPRMNDSQFQDEVAFFYTSGRAQTLQEAYEMAEKLLPEAGSSGKITASRSDKDQNQTAQTRRGRSLNGAPSRGGSNPQSKGRIPTISEALKSGMRQAGVS